jgi:hypothetical protein
MKRLFVILIVASAVIIAGCSKIEDEVSPGSPQDKGTLKDNPNPRPLEGTINGFGCVTGYCAEGAGNAYFAEGTGDVSHMGNTTCTLVYCSITEYAPEGPGGMVIPVGGAFEGTGVMVAANGDEVYCTLEGDYEFVYNAYWQLVANNITGGTALITGGTGRFEGAQGSFEFTGTQDMTIFPCNTPTSLSLVGSIIY